MQNHIYFILCLPSNSKISSFFSFTESENFILLTANLIFNTVKQVLILYLSFTVHKVSKSNCKFLKIRREKMRF